MLIHINENETSNQNLYTVAQLKTANLIQKEHGHKIHRAILNGSAIMKNDTHVLDVGSLEEYSNGVLNDKIIELRKSGYKGLSTIVSVDNIDNIDNFKYFEFKDFIYVQHNNYLNNIEPIKLDFLIDLFFVYLNDKKSFQSYTTNKGIYLSDKISYTKHFTEKNKAKIMKDFKKDIVYKLFNIDVITDKYSNDDIRRIIDQSFVNINGRYEVTDKFRDLIENISFDDMVSIGNVITKWSMLTSELYPHILKIPYFYVREFVTDKLFTSFEAAEEYAKTLDLNNTAHIYQMELTDDPNNNKDE